MNQPKMMTVREIARTGLMSEHALRLMLKAGKLPAIFIGNKALINYDKLCDDLSAIESMPLTEEKQRGKHGIIRGGDKYE